ncbi:MAG: nucleotidyltransferase domain-containing protein [Dehalococcoidia bacterium]|nr:nucleotidyltransferase domain-containing protein [Dehalococcoidia bacterium]
MVVAATELEAVIGEFVRLLAAAINVDAIVLYGSYANGRPHEDSDIDVAVISTDFEGVPMWKRQEIIALASLDRDRRLAPIGYPSSEYHNPGRHSFLREIIRTGRVVYEGPRE